MTVLTHMPGLPPSMRATGAGSAVAKRIVAPRVGGPATSYLLELLIYLAIFLLMETALRFYAPGKPRFKV